MDNQKKPARKPKAAKATMAWGQVTDAGNLCPYVWNNRREAVDDLRNYGENAGRVVRVRIVEVRR